MGLSMSSTSSPVQRRGFTFVELVVVISIIAALAAIGFPVWRMVKNRVDTNATEALVNNVATAMTTYQIKTWTWNIGTAATPRLKTYHLWDLNHNDSSDNPKPDLPSDPKSTAGVFWSIDGYIPPATNSAFYNASTETWTDFIPAGETWDGGFPKEVLKSGYTGFINMAQPSIKKSFINKRGQVVDAWKRPLRIAYAARVYGTQSLGIWSAGLDGKDQDKHPTSDDDLKSWESRSAH
jgi:prepilin-type N-terminal cleavage/methylation domain-containing protein